MKGRVAAAWVIWFSLVRAGEASRVAVYTFAVPLAAIVGVVLLGEELRASFILGIALVAFGIYLVNRPGASRTQADVERIGDE